MAYSYLAGRIAGGVGADDRYWEALEDGEFRLPRCSGCGRWSWPADWRCGVCGSWEMDWVEVEPEGTVYSWTRSHYAFDRTRERAAEVPYVVVLAEIPAAGSVRVLGALAGDERGLRIGAPVRGRIEPPSEMTKGYAAIRWELCGGGGGGR